MRLPEICIRRPVLATMMNLALVLFGVVSLLRLPVRELPDVDPPIVNVTTVYPGANARVVETEVTERLEEAINSVEGIKTLQSESREEVSSLTVEFTLARDIEAAAQDVRDRVARVRALLPRDVKDPVVAKQDADATPILWISFYSDHHGTLELTQMVERLVKDRLQTVRGVSFILIGGQKRFAIRLWLDAEKMAARQVTVLDIQEALRRQNVELPSGRVESWEREMTMEVRGQMKTTEEFDRLVVREEGATLVRLGDVGRATVGVENERSVARYNSKPSVGVGVVKQSKANTIEVARKVKEELEAIRPLLPTGVRIAMPYDESVFVERSIREVWLTLGIAFGLVVATIFLFLRNLRSTLVPSLSIPVSIAATFLVLGWMGYSVNILTMLALVLAIGIVVDDSIVVLENIYRHVEEGLSPVAAALKGMKEISFAILAITFSLVAVFLPLAFQTSLTGRLFIEFAVALAGSVLISAFVALSLTPMLASRVLRPIHEVRHGSLFNSFESFFAATARRYRRMLEWALRHRTAVVGMALGSVAAAALFYWMLEKEFLPEEDKGRLFCFLVAPEGATSEYTDRMVRKMEEIVAGTPEVDGYFSAVALARDGPGKTNEGVMFIRLKDGRKRGVTDIVGGPRGLAARFFREIEGAIAIPIIPKAIGRSFSQTFRVVIQGQDLEELDRVAARLVGEFRRSGFLLNPRSAFEMTKPELRVSVDRDRAAALGLSLEDISRSLQILFGGLDLSRISVGGKEYQVIAQLARESRLAPSDLERLYVRNDKGALIQLSNVVKHEVGAGPNTISHYNRFRAAAVSATPVGVPLGTAMVRAEEILSRELPPDFRYEWGGESKDLKESGRELAFVLLLAILVVYMVLAAQFESFVHPFTVMLALPLAAIGAMGALWLLSRVHALGVLLQGWANASPDPPWIARALSALLPRLPAMTINLFSEIGIVLLIGLVTKTSILLVEFANQRVAAGLPAREAIMEAAMIRLRPILMTAVSTIAGILPIAIGFGVGAESRRPMGVAAVGGLLTSTFLTLFVIPVAYTLFHDLTARLSLRGRRATKDSQTAGESAMMKRKSP